MATNGFEEAELLEPREALEHVGATVKVIAPKSGKIQAMKHDEKSQQINGEITLDKADPEEYDALLFPGGAQTSRFSVFRISLFGFAFAVVSRNATAFPAVCDSVARCKLRFVFRPTFVL